MVSVCIQVSQHSSLYGVCHYNGDYVNVELVITVMVNEMSLHVIGFIHILVHGTNISTDHISRIHTT